MLARLELTDQEAKAHAILKEHRDSIDRLDAILIYTLGERFRQTRYVGRLKAKHNLPPSDPSREAGMVKRLEELAELADLNPEFAKKFINFVIQEVIRHHEQERK